ncbi:MAG: phage late control D family protein, partial [bacterium]|nr:phage late control D family protein [bacterium]
LTARFQAIGATPQEDVQDILYLDGATLDFGKRLSASLGPAETERTVFEGFVSGLEVEFHEGKPPEVTAFAEDRLMDLRMTRRSRTYEDTTDAEIAETIAGEHGLSAEVDADGPTYDLVQQWNMSDLAFLRQRARLIQAEIWLQQDTLYFQTRDKRTGTDITLVQGNHLLDVQARADLAHQRTTVRVSGYDAGGREMVDEEAGPDAVDAEISDGLTGASVLERAFGERMTYRVREAPLNGSEAAAWARAEMLRRARGFVTVAGITRGTPDMVVGSRLTLERVGHPFDGAGYYVTRVCQTYDSANGHRTEFSAERATIQEGA